MKNKLVLLGLCAFACSSVLPVSAATSRVWTDASGRKVEATFVKLEGDNITIQLANGQVFTMSLSRFSAEDQAIAKTLPPHENANALMSVPTNASAAEAAKKIDQLVQQGIVAANPKLEAAHKADHLSKVAEATKTGKPAPVFTPFVPVKPNPPLSDEQFVRRAYLDIVGRIPSYNETVDFLKNSAADKRMKLIDTLLETDGYVSHMFNYFAEMLRMIDRFEGGGGYVRGLPYIKWFKEQLVLDQKGKTGWDKMVHAMVTADGKIWDNGAAGYLLRDSGMPLDNLANTLTVFLGTDVACAQCHDHPFSDWTQRQFYEMAAFFGATTTRYNGRQGGMMMSSGMNLVEEAAQLAASNGGADPRRIRNVIGNVVGANRYVVADLDKNSTKLPHDYKYKDGAPGDPVLPKLIMWTEDDKRNPAYAEINKNIKKSRKSSNGEVKDAEDLRGKFANWATHPANPRFAMTIANRMWQRAFGVGLTPTVKNIDNPDEAYNPALLKHLASEMVRVKFNLKDFMRIIYNTKTYQSEATTEEIAMGVPYYFQGPMLRRMTAEQAWDSFMTLVLGEKEIDLHKNTASGLYARSVDMDLSNPKLDAKTVLLKVAAAQTMDQKARAKTGGSLAQAGAMMEMEGGADEMDAKIPTYAGMTLMRAAELPQPSAGGHFLRDFGQSERTLIDGGSREGSVPQVLMMMNGKAQEMLTNPDSLIFRNMNKVTSPSEKAEVIFLSLLGRHPTLREKDIAKRETSSGDDGYGSMIWALINTREFCFIQ
jgi:hypothetical protein